LSIVSEKGTQTPGGEDFEAALFLGMALGHDFLISTGAAMLSNPFLVNALMMNIRRGAFNGAGTALSPRFVSSTAFFGDEPSPPLLACFA